MLQSTDSRHYPQERGARFAEVGGRFTGMPRMTLRLRYLTWKLRAWFLAGDNVHQLVGTYPILQSILLSA